MSTDSCDQDRENKRTYGWGALLLAWAVGYVLPGLVMFVVHEHRAIKEHQQRMRMEEERRQKLQKVFVIANPHEIDPRVRELLGIEPLPGPALPDANPPVSAPPTDEAP